MSVKSYARCPRQYNIEKRKKSIKIWKDKDVYLQMIIYVEIYQYKEQMNLEKQAR